MAISRERVEWSQCFAAILLSGVSLRRGAPDRALQHLNEAEQRATATGMLLHRAVSRHRQGEIIGGDSGQALRAEALDFMIREEIKNPSCMLQMLSPRIVPAL